MKHPNNGTIIELSLKNAFIKMPLLGNSKNLPLLRVHLISYLLFDKYYQCACQTSVCCQTLYLIIFVILNNLLLFLIFRCLHLLVCLPKGDIFHSLASFDCWQTK